MDRRAFILAPLAFYCANAARAATWSLITRDEFEQSRAQPLARSLSPTPKDAAAPVIEVEQPDAAKPIRPPVTIRIRFRPREGATIDVASFRATYGSLGVDITQRIIAHAHVSASGILAKGAEVPPGHHSVTLQIADNLHRVGFRTLAFTVV